MIHECVILNWRPATLNELLSGQTWHKASRLKKRDREMVEFYSSIYHHIPEATGKRRVSLRVVSGKGRRNPDPDAFWKSLLDALVHAKMLVDDSPKWCELGTVEYSRAETTSTTIILEDLE